MKERTVGESKWSTRALIKYAISNVTSFSAAPMQIVTILGILMLCASVVLGITALYQKFTGIALGGFTTVHYYSAVYRQYHYDQLGIIGYYIAKIYEEIKGRPRYVVSETCGKDKTDEKTAENI